MVETTKTFVFVVLAVLLLTAMLAIKQCRHTHGALDVSAEEELGKPLFPEFVDPLAAASMEILRVDASNDGVARFKVANVDGQWVIPSEQNYPADAADRLLQAATALVDLPVVSVAGGSDEADYEMFGVIEPNLETYSPGKPGVGTAIVMRDEKNNDLARVIVGKEAAESEGLRYVRIPGRARVYTVKIDLDLFTTRFEDWIEQNLLEVTRADIERIALKDYSVTMLPLPNGDKAFRNEQRLSIALNWDYDINGWRLEEFEENFGGRLVPIKLSRFEEINTPRINALREALEQLTIAGVARKPANLVRNLRDGGELLRSKNDQDALEEAGFFLLKNADGAPELHSSDGEVIVKTTEGIEILLRFGEIAGAAQDENDETKLNRFLFITARLDESAFPKPEPAPVPEAPQRRKLPEDASEEAKADAETEYERQHKAWTALRDEIERKNQRDLDEVSERRADAMRQVREKNYRFADWFYIVSEDEYRKIHLGRADVIRESEQAAIEGDGVDAFRYLESGVETK